MPEFVTLLIVSNIMCPSVFFVTVIFGYCISEVSEWLSEAVRMMARSASLQDRNLLSGVRISADCTLSYIKWVRMFKQQFSWTLIWMLAWNLIPFIIFVYWNVPEASLPSVVMVSVTELSFLNLLIIPGQTYRCIWHGYLKCMSTGYVLREELYVLRLKVQCNALLITLLGISGKWQKLLEVFNFRNCKNL